MKEQLNDLLPKEVLLAWNELTDTIDSLYDVDRLWNKGFGDWQIAAVASEIAWHYDHVVRMITDDGMLNVLSASFGNIISAMEGGMHDAISNNN